MRILGTSQEISEELVRLISGCVSCRIAVAWASVGFTAFDALRNNSHKIDKMIVGTHFYQTHPDFIERFLEHEKVQFVLDTDGVFHPKVYFFSMPEERWECIIGSPNFTAGALGVNRELAVALSHADVNAVDAKAGVISQIEDYWLVSKSMTPEQLSSYRKSWKRKRPILKSLGGKFGGNGHGSDGGKHPLEIAVLNLSWEQFFQKVQDEELSLFENSLDARLKVVLAAKTLFDNHERFDAMQPNDRKKVAGLLKTGETDYRLFGSMLVTWHFKDAVNSEDERLTAVSDAIDVIPLNGSVSREQYLDYIARFQNAFPGGGSGLATATRLLAMKRPDYFICVDKKNTTSLCKAFGVKLKGDRKYEQYWDSIIARILAEADWWHSLEPESEIEANVWNARVAFLDSLYYTDED